MLGMVWLILGLRARRGIERRVDAPGPNGDHATFRMRRSIVNNFQLTIGKACRFIDGAGLAGPVRRRAGSCRWEAGRATP
jgi:hypothetical protein